LIKPLGLRLRLKTTARSGRHPFSRAERWLDDQRGTYRTHEPGLALAAAGVTVSETKERKKPSFAGNEITRTEVRFWHLADILLVNLNCPLLTQSRHSSHFNGGMSFRAGFSVVGTASQLALPEPYLLTRY